MQQYKIIVILGASCTGKTTLLRKIFGVEGTYGTKMAIQDNKYVKNGYQYLPEPRENITNTKEFIDFMNNGNTTIVDVNWDFRSYFFDKINHREDVKTYVLSPSGKDLKLYVKTRGGKNQRKLLNRSLICIEIIKARSIGKWEWHKTPNEIETILTDSLEQCDRV